MVQGCAMGFLESLKQFHFTGSEIFCVFQGGSDNIQGVPGNPPRGGNCSEGGSGPGSWVSSGPGTDSRPSI